jgi:flagellin-specific chaperone FliS
MNEANQIVIVSALGFLVIKEVISMLFDRHKKNTEALEKNTIAMVKLETKIEHLQKAIDILPKMQKDIDEAHSKLRILTKE